MKTYMTPRVEQQNSEYAQILLQDYAGSVSEFTAIMLYTYQQIIKSQDNKQFAKTLEEISIDEMRHLELLGRTISLLGLEPEYHTIDCSNNKEIPWTAQNVNYVTKIKEMLLVNIQSEQQAIINYEEHRKIIDDKYIKQLLTEIIADEEEHLRIFKRMYAACTNN